MHLWLIFHFYVYPCSFPLPQLSNRALYHQSCYSYYLYLYLSLNLSYASFLTADLRIICHYFLLHLLVGDLGCYRSHFYLLLFTHHFCCSSLQLFNCPSNYLPKHLDYSALIILLSSYLHLTPLQKYLNHFYTSFYLRSAQSYFCLSCLILHNLEIDRKLHYVSQMKYYPSSLSCLVFILTVTAIFSLVFQSHRETGSSNLRNFLRIS